MDKPVVIVFVADLHINSTVALAPPRVQLDDGGTFVQSKEQRWIHRKWLEFWERVKDIDRAALVVVIVGDVVEGNHHGSTQVITTNETTQERMAIDLLEPVAALADHLFIIRGTEAHAGPSAHWEETIAKDLGAEPQRKDVYSWWHLPLQAHSTLFDIAHHPQTMSRRPWTRDQAASRQAAITWAQYCEAGLRPPDVVVRAHGHQLARGWSRDTVGLFLSPWQLTTAFGHRLGAGHNIEPLGGAIFKCQEKGFTWEKIQYRPRPTATWTLPKVS